MAIPGAGFTLHGFDEHAPDAEFAARYPRAERYLEWPMLVVFTMRARSVRRDPAAMTPNGSSTSPRSGSKTP